MPTNNSTDKSAKSKTSEKKVTETRSAKVRERVYVPGAERVNKHVGGFVAFLREQSVIGLAVGLVIGTQIKQLVDSLVNSFINPLVALLMPGSGDLAQKSFSVRRAGEKPQIFHWGAFVATTISFVIVAAVVYFGVKGLKLDKLDKKKEG